jgi:hypothetical protein
MKHQLHVLENAIVDSHKEKLHLFSANIKRVEACALTAKRFVFDAEASRYLGAFTKDHGDFIIENLFTYARPPYPVTYIEYDFIELARGMQQPILPNADKRIGILLDQTKYGWDIFVCAGDETGHALFEPFVYHISDASRPSVTFASNESASNNIRLGLLMGFLTQRTLELGHSEECLRRVSVSMLGPINRSVVNSIKLEQAARQCAGSFKIAMTTLMLMNQQHHKVYTFVPPAAVLNRGKRRVVAAHTTVKFDLLAPRALYDSIRNGERAPPIRHAVRGHFAHRGLVDGCEHSWPPIPDGLGHWRCGACGGLRWWKREHERGVGEIGEKRYEISAHSVI